MSNKERIYFDPLTHPVARTCLSGDSVNDEESEEYEACPPDSEFDQDSDSEYFLGVDPAKGNDKTVIVEVKSGKIISAKSI